MFSKEVQQLVGRLLSVGVALTSLFLVSSGVSDPVNVTKMTVAGGVGIAGLSLFLIFGCRKTLRIHQFTLIFVFLFLFAGLNAVLFSNSPIAQNIYGTYGRNTGFLTYLFMVGVLLSALMLETEKNFKHLVYGLLFTGVINVIYCAWVIAFGDFLSWTNPYGNILGLFGNPDFISAFLGMFITTAVALMLDNKLNLWQRLCLLILSAGAFFEIYRSHAIQGVVVSVGGVLVIGFYFVRARYSKKVVSLAYLFGVTVIGLLAVAGTFQRGPFSFVYKRSVSLRGSYWHAGIDMGMKNPLHGVGFDTYGDWYRRSRPPVALIDLPGVNIMSNVSHNVVIDFFASGGWPLVLSYLAILLVGISSIIKVTMRGGLYDSLFVAMAATWMCYQAQSIISINQVGLTIWGWVLTGALISYEKYGQRDAAVVNPIPKKVKNLRTKETRLISPSLVASLGAMVGLFLAAPALNAETTWQKSIRTQNLETIKNALMPTFMNPASSYKYAQAVDLFQRSNLMDLAHEYALKATTFNPDYFDAWKLLYYLPNVTASEKEVAFKNMTRLDPLNPDVTQIR